jgi:hypothetical protein
MKLLKGTIRPGLVLEVLENGNIKASAPGLFSFSDDPAKMPPIMPWQIGSNCNSFSQPKVNDDVWIMNFEDNPRQLYWFRKDRVANNTNIPLTEENVEILCNREVGGDWMTIYFSDGSGWVIGKGDSIINIKADGSILLDTSNANRAIDICGDGVYLGGTREDSDFHPIAFGDETQKVLYSILAALKIVQQVSMVNPYTMAIGTALLPQLATISSGVADIVSDNVYST